MSSCEASNVPVVTKADFIRSLRAMGLGSGDTLMVHSSIKSFGRFDGGAEAIIAALFEVVGPEGTVCVPTLTGGPNDGNAGPRVFDARSTPCWTGALCEVFRKRPDARRSLHPTHSIAAAGKRAEYLTQDHHLAQTPCGKGSPWLKLAEVRGHVLFIGVKFDSCTLLHGVEELAQASYVMKSRPAEAILTDQAGREFRGQFRIHSWDHPRRFHDAVYPELVKAKLLKTGQAGNATLLAVRADEFVDFALPRLQREPNWLLA